MKTTLIDDPTEMLFSHLMQEVEDFAIFLLDPAGRFATWNPGVERLLGYSEAEFVGKDFASIFTPEDVRNGVPIKELAQAAATGRAEDERWHTRQNGTTFWASGLVTRVTGDTDSTQGYVKIMRDRTAHKRQETELARYAEQLARSNADLRQFAGTVSHDLNAPLQTVLGFANIAAEEARSGDPALLLEPLEYVVKSTKQMISLVTELLDFSEVSARELTCSAMSADGALREAIGNLGAAIEQSGARIEVDELPIVSADHRALTRIFQNLLDNAIKYSKADQVPQLKITASANRSMVVVSIRDSGIGMSKADASRSFGLFERASSESATGHGMGLAICRRLAESMGGALSVASDLGVGSTFTLALRKPEINMESASTKPENNFVASHQHDTDESRL